MKKETIQIKYCLQKFYVFMKRVAVVDDEPDITNVLKKGLERQGFAIDTFNDPHSALASFQPKYYDLMIIDKIVRASDIKEGSTTTTTTTTAGRLKAPQ